MICVISCKYYMKLIEYSEIKPIHYCCAFRWSENAHDCCVSKKYGPGYPIPAWYVTLEDDQDKNLHSDSTRWIIARDENDAIIEAQKTYPGKKFTLNQDSDTLEAWLHLSLLGRQADMDSTVVESGPGILFHWLRRIMMMGKQLGDHAPFQKV